MVLEFVKIYFIRGEHDRRSNFAISQPPLAGHTTAFIIGNTHRRMLFHPYTLWSANVSHDCEEVEAAVPYAFDLATMIRVIRDTWITYKSLGLAGDFLIAEEVLNALGGEAPQGDIPRDTTFCQVIESAKSTTVKQRGKEPDAARFRPIKMSGKRGAIAQFFRVRGSVPEAMAKFNMTRSGVLSHLFCIWRDHGVGYTVGNNCAELQPPPNVQLFADDTTERRDIFA